MESRNISLTLEKAKEWYNSGNEALKEAALQAYTEYELKTIHFSKIKSFEDAKRALGMNPDDMMVVHTPYKMSNINRHLIAIYRLDIIRKALNRDWKPSLVEGIVYYPCIRFYPAEEIAIEAARSTDGKVCQTFITNGEKYFLVSGYYSCSQGGLSNLSCMYGFTCIGLGLLGCKSREIAKHMGAYFAKEIFEACYAHHVGTYEWV